MARAYVRTRHRRARAYANTGQRIARQYGTLLPGSRIHAQTTLCHRSFSSSASSPGTNEPVSVPDET
eukprot:1380895-Rhodomonas_salina.5